MIVAITSITTIKLGQYDALVSVLKQEQPERKLLLLVVTPIPSFIRDLIALILFETALSLSGSTPPITCISVTSYIFSD